MFLKPKIKRPIFQYISVFQRFTVYLIRFFICLLLYTIGKRVFVNDGQRLLHYLILVMPIVNIVRDGQAGYRNPMWAVPPLFLVQFYYSLFHFSLNISVALFI
jgi:hypothetical protein